MQHTLPAQLNGIALACMITLVHCVYVIDTKSTGLLKDGRVWLLLGWYSDVKLKYAESKSSEKPKCCFIEPVIERTETSETRALRSTGTYMILDAELRYIQ